jgi:hypothetical protein
VLAALRDASFEALIADDVVTAELLGLAPFGASAEVTGEGAESFVEGVTSERVTVLAAPEGFVVRAKDSETLTAALRDAPRPTAKFRVAVN